MHIWLIKVNITENGAADDDIKLHLWASRFGINIHFHLWCDRYTTVGKSEKQRAMTNEILFGRSYFGYIVYHGTQRWYFLFHWMTLDTIQCNKNVGCIWKDRAKEKHYYCQSICLCLINGILTVIICKVCDDAFHTW